MLLFVQSSTESLCVSLSHTHTHARARAGHHWLSLALSQAEALSTRIAIMTHGKLQCIGTPPHLKHRFGRGYRIELQLKHDGGEQTPGLPAVEVAARQFVRQDLGGEVMESFGTRLVCWLPSTGRSTAQLFTLLEEQREQLDLRDYSVAQPTMEQIFLQFALADEQQSEQGAGRATDHA